MTGLSRTSSSLLGAPGFSTRCSLAVVFSLWALPSLAGKSLRRQENHHRPPFRGIFSFSSLSTVLLGKFFWKACRERIMGAATAQL